MTLIGNNGTYMRIKKLFTQLLSSVKYVSGYIVGLNDSVSGNDVEFKGSACFEGFDDAYIDAGNVIELDLQNFEFEWHCADMDVSTNNTFCFLSVQRGTGATQSGWRFDRTGSPLQYQFMYGTGGSTAVTVATTLTDEIESGKVNLKLYNSNLEIWHNDELVFSTTLANAIDYSNSARKTTIFSQLGAILTTGKIWNIQAYSLDSAGNRVSLVGNLPLCEPIADATNHTYYDISGDGNHASIINGNSINQGSQDEFHWLQNGFSKFITLENATNVLSQRFNLDYAVPTKISFEVTSKYWESTINQPLVAWGNLRLKWWTNDVVYLYCHTENIGVRTTNADTSTPGIYRCEVDLGATGLQNKFKIYKNGTLLTLVDLGTDQTLSTGSNIFYLYTGVKTTLSRVVYFDDSDNVIFDLNKLWINPADYLGDLVINDANYLFNTLLYKTGEEFIPKKYDDSIDALGNSLAIPQDGYSFLNSVALLKNADVLELKTKDIYNVWFDGNGDAKQVSFDELVSAIQTYPDVYGGEITHEESIKNISLK